MIDSGRVIAEGTSDELKRMVGGERIEIAVARHGNLERAQEVLGRHAPAGEAVSVDPKARRVSVLAPGGASSLAEVVRDLDAAEVQLDDLSLRRPTLDDVFLALTGRGTEATEEADPGEDIVEMQVEHGVQGSRR